jgi:hypothetical protein
VREGRREGGREGGREGAFQEHAVPRQDPDRLHCVAHPIPCTIPETDLDLTQEDHVAQLGYGRVVLLFQCSVAPNSTTSPEMQELAFIEEL